MARALASHSLSRLTTTSALEAVCSVFVFAHPAQPSCTFVTSAAANVEPQTPDPFTRSLQQKTEEQLLQLLEKNRQPDAEEEAAEQQEDESDDTVDVVNPETGEVLGYRGKEPTRFGDWEHKGRCTDFS